MKCQIEIPEELNKKIKQFMLDRNYDIKSNAIIDIVQDYFKK